MKPHTKEKVTVGNTRYTIEYKDVGIGDLVYDKNSRSVAEAFMSDIDELGWVVVSTKLIPIPLTKSFLKWYRKQLCWDEFKQMVYAGTALGLFVLIVFVYPKKFAIQQCHTEAFLNIEWYWLLLIAPLISIALLSTIFYITPLLFVPVHLILDLFKASEWEFDINPDNKVSRFFENVGNYVEKRVSKKTQKMIGRAFALLFILLIVFVCLTVLWIMISDFLCIKF